MKVVRMTMALLILGGVSGGSRPTLPENYAVSNAAPGFKARYRGEFFDVYSTPLKTRYGDVYNKFDFSKSAGTTVELPAEIVRRFNGSAMAITGFEPSIVRKGAFGEELVPCTEMYNHHWSNMMFGLDSPESFNDDDEGEDWVYSGARSWGARAGGAQTAQFFSEGNGNEHRLSFRGYAEGYAQVISSPTHFAPGLMFIDTRWDDAPLAPLIPRTAIPAQDYSPLLECPCSTRRVIGNDTIDGIPVKFGCDFEGENTGVGRAMMKMMNNTACRMETMHGGSNCCRDKMVLLDEDQRQPELVHETFFKTRFYFEEARQQHENLFRVYWQAELRNNEYDVPACAPHVKPSDCVFVMTNEGVASETLWSADPTGPVQWTEKGIKLIYLGGHCHVGCLSLDLINMNTGETICHAEPTYSPKGSGAALDEPGYALSLPPCLWADDDPNLEPPYALKPTDRIQIIARYNSSRLLLLRNNNNDRGVDPRTTEIAHYGVMSMFQGRAAQAH